MEKKQLTAEIKKKHKYFEFQFSIFEDGEFLDTELGILLDEVIRYITTLNGLNVQDGQEEKNKTLEFLISRRHGICYQFEDQMFDSFKSFAKKSSSGEQLGNLSSLVTEINRSLQRVQKLVVTEKPNQEWKEKCVMSLKFLNDHYGAKKEILSRTNKENQLYDKFIADLDYITQEINKFNNIGGYAGSEMQSLNTKIKELQAILNKIDLQTHRKFFKQKQSLSRKLKELKDDLEKKIDEREKLENVLKTKRGEMQVFNGRVHRFCFKNADSENEFANLKKELITHMDDIKNLNFPQDLKMCQKECIKNYEKLQNELNNRFTVGKGKLKENKQRLYQVESELKKLQKPHNILNKTDGEKVIIEINKLQKYLNTIDTITYKQFDDNKRQLYKSLGNMLNDTNKKIQEWEKLQNNLKTQEAELEKIGTQVNSFSYQDNLEPVYENLKHNLIKIIRNFKELKVTHDLKISQDRSIMKAERFQDTLKNKYTEGKMRMHDIQEKLKNVEEKLQETSKEVNKYHGIKKAENAIFNSEIEKIQSTLANINVRGYNKLEVKKKLLNEDLKKLMDNIQAKRATEMDANQTVLNEIVDILKRYRQKEKPNQTLY